MDWADNSWISGNWLLFYWVVWTLVPSFPLQCSLMPRLPNQYKNEAITCIYNRCSQWFQKPVQQTRHMSEIKVSVWPWNAAVLMRTISLERYIICFFHVCSSLVPRTTPFMGLVIFVIKIVTCSTPKMLWYQSDCSISSCDITSQFIINLCVVVLLS